MALDRRTFLRAGALATLAGSAAVSACSRSTGPAQGPVLTAAQSEVDLGGGVVVPTWVWNGRLPAEEIRLTRGQTLQITLTNNLPEPSTVHWHGLAVPNAMDGVPVLTQQPVEPGGSFRYEFSVPDAGTYWAHPHYGSQLDRGLYAPVIIEDPADGADYDDELTLIVDDWLDGTGTNPDEVLRTLQRTGMKPMEPGGPGVTPVAPLGADGGDVTYPHFLINGRVPADPVVAGYRSGQRVRLRIINAGGDSAFRVGIPGVPLRVTHTDGFPVMPRQVDSVLLGMGERADAIVTLGDTSVPVVAAPYGKDGYAQLNLQVGGAPLAGDATDVQAFASTLSRQVPLNTATLTPTEAVTLPAKAPDRTVDLRLSGPVEGYRWLINGEVYDPAGPGLPVRPGERVRLRFVSESMMFHPMHLHGHTFEVVGADGPRARKDTVLVPPEATVEVDFDTDNPGKWISHCHNEYHLEAGMATYLEYTS
ncbi:copper oxidase [Mycolicibacterium duvalii]|uniref:Putative oxidase (Copper-binding protein) n=1 Tax=Mycolicibacterium duvalii TaxID=39688 RepID=A0A7I7K1V1_9MYCO|nr:multicopper oxidase family protein [Mycolicibacterium duvalii]PEG36997.1 copper oxidase [Mycolicibacterium duvalii]BBX17548.1 putative oxidase (copper-binding protein) [Mycolicibacterium duvalii]